MKTANPSSAAESPDTLPARMLNEFVYCPRLFYYEFVEGVFAHNADTLAGAAAHKRVDSGKGDLPPGGKKQQTTDKERDTRDEGQQPNDDGQKTRDKGQQTPEVIHSRSVFLASERLNASAKMDLVEMEKASGDDLFSLPRVCPVDYKVGSPRESEDGKEIWDADKVQLGLQALILRDNGYACDQAVIFYRGTRQRVTLDITPELEEWIIAQLAAARQTAKGPIPPPLEDSPKCPRCSLVGICLPDETRLIANPPSDPAEEDDPPPEQSAFSFDIDFPTSRLLSGFSGQDQLLRNNRLPVLRPARRLIAAADDKRPLYLNTPGLYVSRSSEILQVKDKEGKVQKYRINDLHHVALFGSIAVSTPVIQTLCQKDIPITYFSMGGWFYGLTRGHSLKNVFTRIEQFRQADRPEMCLRLARNFVHGKIRNQRTLLMRNHLELPKLVSQKLKYAASSVFDAETLDQLLGIEGAAALTYFQNFSGMIKNGNGPGENGDSNGNNNGDGQKNGNGDVEKLAFTFDFTRRNRRPPKDAVNALLSLGYSLLSRDCTLAAYAVGFDPYIGFYHQPRFGRPALALDLMEEFRPLVVDSVVLTLLNNRVLAPKDFVRAGDAVNLSPGGRKIFFEFYEKRLQTVITHPVFDYKVSYRRAIELQFRLLAKFLTGEIDTYLPFMTR